MPVDRAPEVRRLLAGLSEICEPERKVEEDVRATRRPRRAHRERGRRRSVSSRSWPQVGQHQRPRRARSARACGRTSERLEAQQRTLGGQGRLRHDPRHAHGAYGPGVADARHLARERGQERRARAAAVGSTARWSSPLTVAPTMLPIATLVFVVYLIARRRRSAMAIDHRCVMRRSARCGEQLPRSMRRASGGRSPVVAAIASWPRTSCGTRTWRLDSAKRRRLLRLQDLALRRDPPHRDRASAVGVLRSRRSKGAPGRPTSKTLAARPTPSRRPRARRAARGGALEARRAPA